MINAIKQALVGLLGSKKAWLAVTGAITAGLMRLGFDVDANTVGLVLSPLLTAIIGQGVADHGKPAMIAAHEAARPTL